ncbi:hypothetical protein L1987_67240 [Smallanthus sonchifolius]|uniref:Uncharacterized protein n=1 Tax=Smallanthus sonchifolius TaxID=185202 RepID=A0ACB9BZC5_9ASTR|nr:hypothetical protein L1987_67240 [Smallanthus sonchifolius]
MIPKCPEMVVEEVHAEATYHKSDWESIMRDPVVLLWPEVWSNNIFLDEENVVWKESLQSVKAKWAEWDHSKLVNLYKPEDHPPLSHALVQGQSLFNDQERIVECLAKWGSSTKNKDHAAWRKISTQTGEKSLWLEVEKNACHEEEHLQRQKMKKHKRGGRFKQSNLFQGVDATGGENVTNGDRKSDRVRHRVKTSGSRK